MRPRFASLALFFFVLPGVALAQVDARVASLRRQLATGKDPSVRSRAAQGLGASDDPEAVRPLCGGLDDASEVVRAASAKGLGTLQEVSALDCLKAHAREADAVAAASIRESIRTLEELKARTPSLYVAFGGVKDRTGALTPELVRHTEQRFARRLVRAGAQLAPKGEGKGAARGVLQKHGIPGFLLMAEVHPTDGDGLRITVVCLSYPDRALLGQVEVQASGAQPADLLKALIPRAIEEAAETFEWST
jgi:hypothetical protein